MQVYDVFMSYRRNDKQYASGIYEALTRDGIKVFWDYDSLENGDYSEDIRIAIENCNNFILLVKENTFDRCTNENDWIFREIKDALIYKKNIVPLFLDDSMAFPNNVPNAIIDVTKYNGLPKFDYKNGHHLKKLLTQFLSTDAVYSMDDDFEIDDDILVKCQKQSLHITIPNGITTIAENAFSNCTLIRSINFCDTLQIIEKGAFQRCNQLEYVELPARIKVIKKRAFYRCQHLKSIKLPDGLEQIEAQAFAFCNSIKQISFSLNIRNIDVTAFEECTSLETIFVVPDNNSFCTVDGVLFDKECERLIKCPSSKGGYYIVPETVQVIDKYAFSNSQLTCIKFIGTIERIEKYAFSYSLIKKIEYPHDELPKEIDRLAFLGSENIKDNPFPCEQKEEIKAGQIKERLILYEYVMVKTSFESEEEAYNMVKMLLENGFIVSGQIKEHRAVYKWEGDICDENEFELLCFTRGALYEKVEKYLLEHHSYDCPEILCFPIINTSVSFGQWILEGTRYKNEQ